MSDNARNAPAGTRHHWTFPKDIPDPAARQARALEYIAMYLDGIDASLSLIAAEVSPKLSRGDGQPLTEGLAFQLQALVKAAKIAGP